MSLSYTGLISDLFEKHTKNVLANDSSEILTYFINTDIEWSYLGLYNWDNVGWRVEENHTHIKSAGHSIEEINFIKDIFIKLDPLIDLDFKEIGTDNGSDIDIYSVEYASSFRPNTIGEVKNQSSSAGHWWEILWKDTDNKSTFSLLDQHTIVHEIGHILGLSHPYEDPFNQKWNTDDTVMSYNQGKNGWNTWFTQADIFALQSMWDRENDNGQITYEKKSSEYQFIQSKNNTYSIKSEIGHEDITGVKFLNFSDKSLHFETDIKGVFDQITGLDDITGKVYRLYNATFGRFPDSSGLQYWININKSGENTYRQTCESFIISREFKILYGENNDNSDYLKRLYTNILGRDFDQKGYNYWIHQLNSGYETRGEVLMGFSESEENKALFTQETGII